MTRTADFSGLLIEPDFSRLAIESGADVVSSSTRLDLTHPETGAPLVDRDGVAGWIAFRRTTPADLRARMRQIERDLILRAYRGARLGRGVALAEVLCWATSDWHLVGLDGAALDLAFTAADGAKVYLGVPWLRRQAAAFVLADERAPS